MKATLAFVVVGFGIGDVAGAGHGVTVGLGVPDGDGLFGCRNLFINDFLVDFREGLWDVTC